MNRQRTRNTVVYSIPSLDHPALVTTLRMRLHVPTSIVERCTETTSLRTSIPLPRAFVAGPASRTTVREIHESNKRRSWCCHACSAPPKSSTFAHVQRRSHERIRAVRCRDLKFGVESRRPPKRRNPYVNRMAMDYPRYPTSRLHHLRTTT